MPSTPIVKTPISDILTLPTAADSVISLFDYFDDPLTTGLTARFELENTSLGGGITHVLLYDQPGSGAPVSVQNFVNYVNDGDYVNSIIHRSIPNFVVQGGGFIVNDLANNLQTPNNAIFSVPTDAPIQNEFSAARSNTRGTIAFAKIGGDPNSATSQWFFNLKDNSASLNSQNDGFTVFGEVISEADLVAVDAIAALPRFDVSRVNGAFAEIPIIFDDPSSLLITRDENFVRYKSITVFQQEELSFAIAQNSNPNLINAKIENNQLILDYLPKKIGSTSITLRATNLQGNAVEQTFLIQVQNPTVLTDFNGDYQSDFLLRSPQGGAAQVVALDRTQIQQIQQVGPTIQDANWQIQGSGQFNGDAIADWVWRNQKTGQTLLWLMDAEQRPTAMVLPSVTDGAWQIHGTGDFNQDDQSDLIWYNRETGAAVLWYISEGQQTDKVPFQLGSVTGKTIVGSGDFDQDGTFELLWQDSQSAALFTQQLESNGVGLSLEAIDSSIDTAGVADGWVLGAIADYTVDSYSDIAWYNASLGELKIWQMNGTTVTGVNSFSLS